MAHGETVLIPPHLDRVSFFMAARDLCNSTHGNKDAAACIECQQRAIAVLGTVKPKSGAPVMPIDEYCKALETWRDAVRAGARDAGDTHAGEQLARIADAADTTFLAIRKSCLLARLLYDGEELRTLKCPIHKGRWAGCTHGRIGCVTDTYPQGCYSGWNVTGWLPTEDERQKQLRWHEQKGWPLREAERNEPALDARILSTDDRLK